MSELIDVRREQRTCVVTFRREEKLNVVSGEVARAETERRLRPR